MVLELEKQKIKAAAYVRMSTEHQKYSPENQLAAIKEYAEKHGYEIVRNYSDAGKSGLNISGRQSLQQMIKDVENDKADFAAILVLDVTRWGRFQDTDESAYYEYICRRAGIKVQYCAEQFENDGSPVSTIIKSVKRTMAAEYSRELSCKVFAGQSRLITLGYRQGGTVGYGLRRMLIDEAGNHKGLLEKGEHKSIATDRVIQVPGTEEEKERVRWIYNSFVNEDKNEGQIADILNTQGVLNDIGNPWNRNNIREILTNEKYIGNNIFNRTSFKLKIKHVKNPETEWVRADGAFESIVNPSLFFIAKGIFASRFRKLSDGEMLEKLKNLKEKVGYLSAMIINETEDMPSSAAYAGRFGGLVRAYQLIGFDPQRDFQYLEINRVLREMHASTLQDVIQKIMDLGATVELSQDNSLLMINSTFTISIVFCRCTKTEAGSYRWKVRFDSSLNPDITIAVRMDSTNEKVLDYYLLPSLDFRDETMRLKENNQDLLDSYCFENLDYLFSMAQTKLIERAA